MKQVKEPKTRSARNRLEKSTRCFELGSVLMQTTHAFFQGVPKGLVPLMGVVLLIQGCTTSFDLATLSLNKNTLTNTTTSNNTPTQNTNTTIDTYVISNVNIAQPTGSTGGSSSSTNFTTSVFFDTTKSTAAVSNHCTGGASGTATSKSCICRFRWNEINPNTGSSVPILRTVQTAVSSVQPSFLTCSAPDVFGTEIPDGTGIAITIVAGPSNPDIGLFTVNSFAFNKSATSSGSFQDAQGHVFDNVLRYSCYQKFTKGINVTSKIQNTKEPTSGASANLAIATQFCVSNGSSAGGAAGGGDGGGAAPTNDCPNAKADFSAQSYYFNLYLRNSERGDFNISNDSFICPTIKEALNSNGQLGTSVQPWPFDATFALSLAPTASFTVGVEANTKLAGGLDPVAGNNVCFPQSSTSPGGTASTGGGAAPTPSSNSFIHSCLGFAARVNLDGTCPTIGTQGNQLLPTFRLRRFVAIYPKLFDVTGAPLSTPQAVDTIYVLDRPISGSPDPTKPFTMLGPKPCPFAFYDRAGVTESDSTQLNYIAGGRGYYGTTNSKWDNKNVDGIEFPNFDKNTPGKLSCSAAIPILSDTKRNMSFATVNINNPPSGFQHLYVRKAKAFAPHYEEDIDFKACAPQAIPLTDPPLHFARDSLATTSNNTNNVGWCAEAYPTQNGNISALDPENTSIFDDGDTIKTSGTGMVPPFTSHVIKNTISNTCTTTSITNFTGTGYSYPTSCTTDATDTPATNLSYCYAHHSSKSPYPFTDPLDTSITADKTCDRTVILNDAFTRFPLLAPPLDVEKAIREDSSYFCSVSFDGVDGPKTGVQTPSDGCCNRDRVLLKTGTTGTATSAHLEPDVACGSPNY